MPKKIINKIIVPPGIELLISNSDGTKSSLRFSFYQATWTGKNYTNQVGLKYDARYMAHCNTVGCQEVFGEGLGWQRDFSDCLQKLVDKGVIDHYGFVCKPYVPIG